MGWGVEAFCVDVAEHFDASRLSARMSVIWAIGCSAVGTARIRGKGSGVETECLSPSWRGSGTGGSLISPTSATGTRRSKRPDYGSRRCRGRTWMGLQARGFGDGSAGRKIDRLLDVGPPRCCVARRHQAPWLSGGRSRRCYRELHRRGVRSMWRPLFESFAQESNADYYDVRGPWRRRVLGLGAASDAWPKESGVEGPISRRVRLPHRMECTARRFASLNVS